MGTDSIISDWAVDIADLMGRACADEFLDELELQRLHYYLHLFRIALKKRIVLAEDIVEKIPKCEQYLKNFKLDSSMEAA